MKSGLRAARHRAVAFLVTAIGVLSGHGIAPESIPRVPFRLAHTDARLDDALGRIPLSFEPRAAAGGESAGFVSRGPGYGLFLKSTEAALVLKKRDGDARSPSVVRMQLRGGSRGAVAGGVEELAGKTNYFIGNDPSKWRTNVPTYAKVRFSRVYPGVDLLYYGNGRELEYDFVLAPRADSSAIHLAFEGTSQILLDPHGDLVLKEGDEEIRLHKPVAYQMVRGRKRQISAEFVLLESREVSFKLGDYDVRQPLVIDPVLVYSTYLGGKAADGAASIAVDSDGNMYVAGHTFSREFPTANPLQTHNRDDEDIVVSKLNASGSALIYSTYLGGTGDDFAFGIAIDPARNVYVTGQTLSTNLPVVNALQPALAGPRDAFVMKLNASGSALVYSTYLGGSAYDYGDEIAADSIGNAYIVGGTSSIDFPTANAMQPANAGSDDVFVVKLNGTGSALLFSTYFGGNGIEEGRDITVDGAGNVYIAGTTYSTNLPVQNPFQYSNGGMSDAFVAKLDSQGALIYSTYLGGSGYDQCFGLAVDTSGNAYVTGSTSSINFPTKNPLQIANGGGSSDAFVTVLNAGGFALVYSTYLGGDRDEQGNSIAVDAFGNAYVAGHTGSTNFPIVNPIQTGGNGFVTKVDTSGSTLLYSTYFANGVNTIAVDASGNAYIAGVTSPDVLPTVNPFQSMTQGSYDEFIAKISDNSIPGILSITPSVGGRSTTFNATIQGSNLSGATAVNFSGTGVTGVVLGGGTDFSLPVSISISSTAAAGVRAITVTASAGTSPPNNAFRVVVPAITSIAPASGVRGLVRIATLTGADLSGAAAVTFSGTGGVTADVVSNSTPTNIQVSIAVATSASAGVRTVTVTTSAGTSQPFTGFTVANPGVISSGTPITRSFTSASAQSALRPGRYADRYQFTLSSSQDVTLIEQSTVFDAYAYLISSDGTVIAEDDDSGGNSNARIHATLNAGTYFAEATTSTLPAQTGEYTLSLFVGPAINALNANPSGLSQASAPIFGAPFTLTVNGANFVPGAVVSVAGNNLTTTRISDSQLTALVSTAALSAGSQDVKVTDPGPFVSNAVPLQMIERGDINGSRTVNIGDALVLALTAGGIRNPPLVPATGDINLNGGVNIGDALTLALFVGRANPNMTIPAISSVSPSPASAGSDLTITGTGFGANAPDNVVLFRTSDGATVRVAPNQVSATSLTVSVPANAVSGPLQVYRLDVPVGGRVFPLQVSGTATPLMFATLTPFFNVLPGTALLLNGLGFDPMPMNNTVLFKSAAGTVAAAVTAASSQNLAVTAPDDAICGPVKVIVGGQTSNGRMIAIRGLSCAVQLSDLWGGGGPGDIVVLEGAGFDIVTPANNEVKFSAASGGMVTATVLSAGETQLQIRIPDTAVHGDVTVTVAGITSNPLSW